MRALLVTLVVLLFAPIATRSAAATSNAVQQLDTANEAFDAREWGKAATAYQSLVAENPYSGEFWYRLGVTRYALKKYEASAEAYQRAVDLGYQVGGSLYNMGCDYALMGEGEKAVANIELAIQNGLRQREQLLREDGDLDSIRGTALFKERILPSVDGVSREEGWRIDLDYLTRRMEQTHYDVYRNVSSEEWAETIGELSDQIDELEDHEIIVEIMKLVTRVGDGHTSVRTIGGPYGFHAIPLRFYLFSDGVFIKAAPKEYADVVGARVLRVGSVPVDEALERVATVTQRDNPMQIKWIAPRYLSVVEILDGLGISDGLDVVEVTVAKQANEEITLRLEPTKMTPNIRDLDAGDLVSMRDETTAPLPLWQKDLASAYWFEYLENERVVYAQFNRVENKEDGETIAVFATRLFEFIDANPVDALVIDVRLNHGGNNYLVKPLVNGVVRSDKINQPGRFFTIIGRETFSACQNFVNRLERETQVTFVGEPTASRPNFVGEGNHIVLPYSGIIVNGSSLYWQDTRSDDYRLWVAPDLVAELSSDDFRSNRDPAMGVIRAYLAQRAANDDRAER